MYVAITKTRFIEIPEKEQNKRRNDLKGLSLRTIFFSSPGGDFI